MVMWYTFEQIFYMEYTFPLIAVVSINNRNCSKHDNDMIILLQIGDTSMKCAT